MTCGRRRARRTGGPPPGSAPSWSPRWWPQGAPTTTTTPDSGPPIATVREVEIFESDVEALASDAGFLSFIGAPEPDEGEDDLSQTEAGRRTLTWLIDRAVIDAELAVQDLAVEDETLDQAEDDLGAGDVPDDVDVIVDGEEEMGDDASDEVAEALAAYVTLDEWLRTIEPGRPRAAGPDPRRAPRGRRTGSAARPSRSTRRTPRRCATSSRRGPRSTRSRTSVDDAGTHPTRRRVPDPRAVPPTARRPVVRDAGRLGRREDRRVACDGAAGGVLRDADHPGRGRRRRPGRRRDRHAATPPRRRRRRVLRARLLDRRPAARRQLGNVGPDRRCRRG